MYEQCTYNLLSEMLLDMNSKITEATKLYDQYLTQQIAIPARRWTQPPLQQSRPPLQEAYQVRHSVYAPQHVPLSPPPVQHQPTLEYQPHHQLQHPQHQTWAVDPALPTHPTPQAPSQTQLSGYDPRIVTSPQQVSYDARQTPTVLDNSQFTPMQPSQQQA